MKKVELFTDKVMGDWVFDKKSQKKPQFMYTREALITLHKDHAQDYVDPETKKLQRVYGEIVLKETKLIDKESSRVDFFQSIEMTPGTIITDVLPWN